MKIPVSVIVVTKNEEAKIKSCLASLAAFDEVVVVDSQSQDKTADIVRKEGAALIEFIWNRQYPKKRQWCLDTLNLKHDWIFFVDADEIITSELVAEIQHIFENAPNACGYFVRSNYVLNGKILKHGLQNNKLILFNKTKMEFPVVDDLDIPGMGEIEGHYQPVLKPEFSSEKIGQLKYAFLHDTLDDDRAWTFKHQKYARWETGMNAKNAWPRDPKPFRNCVKNILRRSIFRPELMFFISYIILLGFLDGRAGVKFAKKKKDYYALIK